MWDSKLLKSVSSSKLFDRPLYYCIILYCWCNCLFYIVPTEFCM